MEEALRRFCNRSEPMVAIRGTHLRNLGEMTVNLSGATIDPPRRPRMARAAKGEPAVFVRELSISGDPITIFGSPLALELVAHEVELDEAKGTDPGIFLVLRQAASGGIRLSIEREDLERLIAKAAALAAKKHGVIIEKVGLELSQPDLRTLDARISLTARKLLFRADIRLSGTVTVDDNFVATISNLRCEGEGAIAALACAAITPHFQRIENRPLPLAALPIGQVRLHDAAFAIDNECIVVSAQFGSSGMNWKPSSESS